VNRGIAWQRKPDYAKALADFDEAIRLDPSCALAYQRRGWLRATCSDANLRDGQKAIADATESCKLDLSNRATAVATLAARGTAVATLAAAYAEARQFEKAIEFQKRAIGLAPKGKKDAFETRLKLYQEGKPYREEPRKK
jgi:tetratricopeptide (TPR) repeat protein